MEEVMCTANDHMAVDLLFYCKACEELLCKKCYRTHPTEHDPSIITIEEYMLHEKTHLESRIEHVKHFIEEVSKLLSRALHLKEQLKDTRKICVDSVQSYDSVVKGLDEWRVHILEIVDEMRRKEQELAAATSTNSDAKGVFKKPRLLHRGSVSNTCLKLAPVFITDRIKQTVYDFTRPASSSVLYSRSQSPALRRLSLPPHPATPPPLPPRSAAPLPPLPSTSRPTPLHLPPLPAKVPPMPLPSPHDSITGSLNLNQTEQQMEQADRENEFIYVLPATGFTVAHNGRDEQATIIGTVENEEYDHQDEIYDVGSVDIYQPIQDVQSDRLSFKSTTESDSQSYRGSIVEELIYESMEEIHSNTASVPSQDPAVQQLPWNPHPLPHPSLPKCAIISNVFTEGVTFSDICTNSDGLIIAANLVKSCLEVFKGNNYCGKINIVDGSPTAVAFRKAHSTKSNSSVLVAGDFGNSSVLKVEITEKFQEKPKALKLASGIPLAIAVSNQCKVKSNQSCFYVATTQLKSGLTNIDIKCLKCNGSSNGMLSSDKVGKNPVAIGYQDGYLVVCDGEEGRLVKISTTNGKPVWDESVDARRMGIMKKPRGIAMLPRGHIAVSDSEAHTVNIFTEDGALKKVIGREGGNVGEFRKPTALAVRNHCELVVVDSLNFRFQILNMDPVLSVDTIPALDDTTEEYDDQDLYSDLADVRKA